MKTKKYSHRRVIKENERIKNVKEIYAALNNQIASYEVIIASNYKVNLKIDTEKCKQNPGMEKSQGMSSTATTWNQLT